MKFKPLIMVVTSVFVVLILVMVLLLPLNTLSEQDSVEINDILQDCTANFDSPQNIRNNYKYNFTIIDYDEKLIYTTTSGLSQNISDAIKSRDTILDIAPNGKLAGKLIISNNYDVALAERNIGFAIIAGGLLCFLALILIAYILYINNRVIKPFRRLTEFALSVAGGDLETELSMDRQNIFGAFTESFDIMRTELKNAKLAEQKANESKKLLIANLSHDIKTPVASIKAIAEVGEVKADKKDKPSFAMINKKADQVNALVSNLFSATLEEMNQLPINTSDHASGDLVKILTVSDYQGKAKVDKIPEMLLSYDSQRLQQVIDNVISNSYKYSNTDIHISFTDNGNHLRMTIKDFGGYSDSSDKLLTKFYRGQNAEGKDGTGLGLYISKYLMMAMDGDLALDCNNDYFRVIIDIKIS